MPYLLPRLSRTLTISALLVAPAVAPLVFLPPAHAQATAQAANTDTLFVVGTSLFDVALQERIDKAGRIDYAKLKGSNSLAAFVAALPGVDVSKFPTFEIKDEKADAAGASRDKKKDEAPKVDRSWELSFWINAHNGLILKALSDVYPVNSPDEVKGLAERKFAVAGKEYTLPEMRALAGKMDPRAPFAMIDGTLSGPKIAPRAVRAYGLNETLESAVRAVVDDPRLVDLQRIENRVAVAPFLATVDEMWKPRAARRKWDGIRYILSAYTSTRANRNYFTTNDYQVQFAPGDRKINAVAPEIGSAG
jgi:hypothetical protein